VLSVIESEMVKAFSRCGAAKTSNKWMQGSSRLDSFQSSDIAFSLSSLTDVPLRSGRQSYLVASNNLTQKIVFPPLEMC
jgi:hypothetical protein